jgi:uncharacterized membrane protein
MADTEVFTPSIPKKPASTKISQWVVKILDGMARGLFASLIIGLIIKQIGTYSGIVLLQRFGQTAQYMMGPAIGVGVAYAIGAPALGIFASAATGAVGAGTIVFDSAMKATLAIGEPVGALVAALVGAFAARLIAGKTKVDILLVPLATIVCGALVGVFLAPAIAAMMRAIGAFVNSLTTLYPIPMGILVSVVVGIILTLPISSAAICISLGISGLAAGAATVGCCAQMIGFAFASYKDNGIGGLVSQGLGTSMIQMPNIVRNWRIWIPATLTAAILGPFATTVFQMENNPAGAGMGTSGLVGQFNTLAVMGPQSWWKILLLHFVLPAVLAALIAAFMRAKGWIKTGDMKLA